MAEEPDAVLYDTLDPTAIDPLSEIERTGAAESTESEVPKFDDRYVEPLQGMLFLGALKTRFSYCGHDFVIRTLVTGEYAEIAVVAQRYVGTNFEGKAYQAATVAACLVSVDGKDLPVMPVSNDQSNVSARFDYIMRRWHPPIVDYVFSRFYELEAKVRELIDELGKPSG